MKTIVYKVKSCSDPEFIESKLNEYSYCTRLIYKKLEESTDKNFLDYCKDRFSLNDIEIRSIVSNATQIKNSFISKIKKTEEEIIDLLIDIEELKVKIDKLKGLKVTVTRTKKLKKLKKQVFNLKRKLARKQRFIKSDVVFGSRKLLKDISYLSNNKELNFGKIKDKKESYLNKRNGTISLMGEANQKGNRFFDFDLVNKIIIYKPFCGNKIEIRLSNRKDKFDELLQNAINNKRIAITVSFNNDAFSISFDEASLHGYSINKSERKKDVKEATKYCLNKEEHSLIVKQVYSDYYKRLKNRKLEDKIENRFLGIDLNPEHIGYSIIDKLENNQVKIIKTGSFNFKKLCVKTGKSSDSKESIYLNNKRKHERKEVVCELFSLMRHYHVSTFVMEDLDFKSNNRVEAKEFNRKVKNIWDRELLTNLINKKCTEGGFIYEVINPVYTSLIGNLSHRVFDPVAASLEITRRGATKYEKGGFSPIETVSTIHTMEVIAKRNHIDVELIRDASWKERHTILNSNVKFRYRWGEKVGITSSLSLGSYRSGIIQNLYCI